MVPVDGIGTQYHQLRGFMLNIKQLEALRAKDKLYKVSDIDGLFVAVSKTGVKSFRYNYRDQGKQKTKTYGTFPELSLSQARLDHQAFKEQLQGGHGSLPTYEVLFNQWYEIKKTKLKSDHTRRLILQQYRDYIAPEIGGAAIDNLPRKQLVKIVTDLDNKGLNETAQKIGTILKQSLDYAVDIGLIDYHAASGLSRVLKTVEVKSMPCIDANGVGQLLFQINTYPETITKMALLFMAHTFNRTYPLRTLEWGEIKDGEFWIAPAEKMKLPNDHVVPLSKQARQILEEVRAITGDRRYVFGSVRGDKPVSENTMLFGLYRLGYKGLMTVHGFRALASTILNEQSTFNKDAIEKQLAHKETDEVRAAYHRALYLDERIAMMQWYSDYLDREYHAQAL